MILFVMCRCFAILRPMANVVNVARRGKVMLVVAWSLATLCSIPQVRVFATSWRNKHYISCSTLNVIPETITLRAISLAKWALRYK